MCHEAFQRRRSADRERDYLVGIEVLQVAARSRPLTCSVRCTEMRTLCIAVPALVLLAGLGGSSMAAPLDGRR